MSLASPGRDANAQLARRLGLWSTMGVVIGITIGSGIFRTPAVVASRVPDPMLMIAVWLSGGLISLCGALCVAELAATFPHTGGWYVFLREGWGRLAGFLFGWSELVLLRASATGAISLVFSEYLLRTLGFTVTADSQTVSYVAAAAIVVTAFVNIRGVQVGAAVTGLSTVAKFGGLTILVLAAVVLGPGRQEPATTTGAASIDPKLFGLALISALYAYDGFADVAFSGGEVTNPGRTLPRAIIGGTLAIIAIYVAANGAYLYVNGIERMSQSRLVAADTMQVLVGSVGVAFISVIVTISTLGALTGIMLTAPRVFFAMAKDRLFFPSLASVHPRFNTPYVAISLAAALGVLFVLTRTFEQLSDTFVLSIWPFYGIAIAGIYRLRRTRPHLARPYTAPGYPLLPAIFIAGVAYLVGNAIVADPLWTGVTFAIVLAGVPVYLVLFARPSPDQTA